MASTLHWPLNSGAVLVRRTAPKSRHCGAVSRHGVGEIIVFQNVLAQNELIIHDRC